MNRLSSNTAHPTIASALLFPLPAAGCGERPGGIPRRLHALGTLERVAEPPEAARGTRVEPHLLLKVAAAANGILKAQPGLVVGYSPDGKHGVIYPAKPENLNVVVWLVGEPASRRLMLGIGPAQSVHQWWRPDSDRVVLEVSPGEGKANKLTCLSPAEHGKAQIGTSHPLPNAEVEVRGWHAGAALRVRPGRGSALAKCDL